MPLSRLKIDQVTRFIMDWRLLDYAKDAEDTAAGLHIFLNEIPQYSKDITGNIAELFAISSALHTLNENLELSLYGRWSGRILRDLEIVLPSLGYTLEELKNMFGKSRKQSKLAPGAFPGTPPYHLIWEDTCTDFEDEGIALPMRLELYRIYLHGIDDVLKGYDPDFDLIGQSSHQYSQPSDEEMDKTRRQLSKMLKKQIPPPTHDPFDSYFSRLNVGDPRPRGMQPLL